MKKEISAKNTKSEILEAYQEAVQNLREIEQRRLEPEKIKEEKKKISLVNNAEISIAGDIDQEIEKFRVAVVSQLVDTGKKLTSLKEEYQNLKEAVEIRKKELKEIFDIEAESLTLTALMEAQKKEEESFSAKMNEMKRVLEDEIKSTKEQWELEKKQYALCLKERNEDSEKKAKRMKEEWEYAFQREKELAQNQFADEKAHLEKELAFMKETAEKNLAEKEKDITAREKILSEKENQIAMLEKRVSAFDKTMSDETQKARAEVTAKLTEQFTSKESLLKKQYEGEINVLNTRITTLEQIIADQKTRMDGMAKQLDASYKKLEEIAMKALESSGSHKTVDSIEKLLLRQDKQS